MTKRRWALLVLVIIIAFAIWRYPVLIGLAALAGLRCLCWIIPMVVVAVLVYKYMERRRKT